MYEAIRIPNIDEILEKPAEAPRMDPIDENMSVMYVNQLEHFQNKTMTATSLVHMQFYKIHHLVVILQQEVLQPIMIAHVAEHIGYYIEQEWNQLFGNARGCQTSKILNLNLMM